MEQNSYYIEKYGINPKNGKLYRSSISQRKASKKFYFSNIENIKLKLKLNKNDNELDTINNDLVFY
jgi:hypothetical protein